MARVVAAQRRLADRLDRDLVFRAGVQVLRIVLKVADRAIERNHAQPIGRMPAIENLEIAVDDIDENAAEHRDAVASIERAERAGERGLLTFDPRTTRGFKHIRGMVAIGACSSAGPARCSGHCAITSDRGRVFGRA
jgi:hypothetical protein